MFCLCYVQGTDGTPAKKNKRDGETSTAERDNKASTSSDNGTAGTSTAATGGDQVTTKKTGKDNVGTAKKTGRDSNANNLPSLCSGVAAQSVVMQTIPEYIHTYFPDSDMAGTFRNIDLAIKQGRSQGVEVVVIKNPDGSNKVRMCPFCLSVLNCGLGLHFRVKGRPLNVLWLREGSTSERSPEWYANRQYVEDMAKSTRVIRDFTEKWWESPLCAELLKLTASDFQVSVFSQ
jgi:hypothetical protein